MDVILIKIFYIKVVKDKTNKLNPYKTFDILIKLIFINFLLIKFHLHKYNLFFYKYILTVYYSSNSTFKFI